MILLRPSAGVSFIFVNDTQKITQVSYLLKVAAYICLLQKRRLRLSLYAFMKTSSATVELPAKKISHKVHRIAVGSLFFTQGLCFASWASRIPTIQQKLNMSEAELGGILLSIPAGLMISLPFSGYLIARFGSRIVTILASLIYSAILLSIGFSETTLYLVVSLFGFGFAGNMMNIAINTQAVQVEQLYGRSIMASFHGLWSLAGFAGAAIGTLMIGIEMPPSGHFAFILGLALTIVALSSSYIIRDNGADRNSKQRIFAKPDKSLLHLGFIAFCAMICEGAMFDWSGVYFRKIVMAEKAWVGAGYTAFMCTMATGRFISDWFTSKFGVERTLEVSGVLRATGLLVSVLLHSLPTAVLGFLIVGFGVSSVVPLVYGTAGKSKVLSAGVALAAVSTIGFLGFLLGPPLIGFVAAATSLRISFTIIAFMGLAVEILSKRLKAAE